MNDRRLYVSPFLVLILAISFYFRLESYVIPIVLAMLLHECGHLLALCLQNKRILQVRFELFGAVIRSEPLPYMQELLCALAGPIVNLTCGVLLRNTASCAAVIHLSVFLFNMLPLYPLDGGRALFVLLSIALPAERVRRVVHIARVMISLAIMCAAVSAAAIYRLGVGFFLFTGMILWKLDRNAAAEDC